MLRGHLQLEVQPQKKNPQLENVYLKPPSLSRSFSYLQVPWSDPPHCLYSCLECLSHQLWEGALKLTCLRERELEYVRCRKWGENGSWPFPQCWGAIGPSGDSGQLEGRDPIQRGAVLPCRNVGSVLPDFLIFKENVESVCLFLIIWLHKS